MVYCSLSIRWVVTDFFPALLVLISIQLFNKKMSFFPAFLITVAGFMKLYPFLMIPLLFVYRPVNKWLNVLLGFLLAFIPFMFVWFPGAARFLEFHGNKPVQIESIQGMFYADSTPIIYERFSWVFDETASNNKILLVALTITYLLLFVLRKRSSLAISSFIVVLLFILLGGIFSPQYMLWLASFLPFISPLIAVQVIGATWLSSFYFQFYDGLVSHQFIGKLPEYLLIKTRNIWLLAIFAIKSAKLLLNRLNKDL